MILSQSRMHLELSPRFSFALELEMDWEAFKIAFWHPFGPHGADPKNPDGPPESVDHIVDRKEAEIERNGGWTLWSFQFRRDLDHLARVILEAAPSQVYAFCSHSKGTKAPSGKVQFCNQFMAVGKNEWQEMPNEINIPHPFGKRSLACAFKVKRILRLPIPVQPQIAVQWYSTKRKNWFSVFPSRNDPARTGYPPKPETLIRPCQTGAPLRTVRAVLELAPPYLVTLRRDQANNSTGNL